MRKRESDWASARQADSERRVETERWNSARARAVPGGGHNRGQVPMRQVAGMSRVSPRTTAPTRLATTKSAWPPPRPSHSLPSPRPRPILCSRSGTRVKQQQHQQRVTGRPTSMARTRPVRTAAAALLLGSLCAFKGVAAQAHDMTSNLTALYGTWSSGSGAVLTGSVRRFSSQMMRTSREETDPFPSTGLCQPGQLFLFLPRHDRHRHELHQRRFLGGSPIPLRLQRCAPSSLRTLKIGSLIGS